VSENLDFLFFPVTELVTARAVFVLVLDNKGAGNMFALRTPVNEELEMDGARGRLATARAWVLNLRIPSS
jgi:hypothetical protein